MNNMKTKFFISCTLCFLCITTVGFSQNTQNVSRKRLAEPQQNPLHIQPFSNPPVTKKQEPPLDLRTVTIETACHQLMYANILMEYAAKLPSDRVETKFYLSRMAFNDNRLPVNLVTLYNQKCEKCKPRRQEERNNRSVTQYDNSSSSSINTNNNKSTVSSRKISKEEYRREYWGEVGRGVATAVVGKIAENLADPNQMAAFREGWNAMQEDRRRKRRNKKAFDLVGNIREKVLEDYSNKTIVKSKSDSIIHRMAVPEVD